MRRAILGAALAMAAAASTPAAALADRYVDSDAPGGAGSTTCSLADPCATIHQALAVSLAEEKIFIDGGTYTGTYNLDGGRSLIGQEFSAPADGLPVLSADPGLNVITVSFSANAGTISGLRILPGTSGSAVALAGPADVEGNVIELTGSNATGIGLNGTGAANSAITGNTIIDPAPTGDRQFAISGYQNSSHISGNKIQDVSDGIAIGGGAPAIEENEISGVHTVSGSGGRAISVLDGGVGANALIEGNYVHSPATTSSVGIEVAQLSISPATATVRRNRVHGHGLGVFLSDAMGELTLASNVITGNLYGLQLVAYSGNVADADLIGSTVADNGTDLYVRDSVLRINSTVVSDPVETVADAATPSCVITHSRGPTAAPGGNGCADFQTTAAPGFADPRPSDPAGGDYHLVSGSAMIDAGDPASPPFGATDIDGGARAVDGTPTCAGPSVARRDIGADEFDPAAPDCTPPDTRITKRPKAKTRLRIAKFRFASTEPGSRFVCKLDRRPFRPCARTFKTPKLRPGRHKLLVAAIDRAGNRDRSPARAAWKILRPRR